MNLCGCLILLASIAPFMGSAIAQSAAIRAELPTIKVGDRWKYEQSDRRTGIRESELNQSVLSVSASQIEGIENEGRFVWTPEMNFVESPTLAITGEAKRLAFPLEVGKKWDYKYNFTNKVSGVKARWQLEATVVAYEKVKVPAGEYDAFRIEYSGFWNNDTSGRSGRLKVTSWFAPIARNIVKTEFEDGFNNWMRHLVECQVQP
jgi:hypothetical protein